MKTAVINEDHPEYMPLIEGCWGSRAAGGFGLSVAHGGLGR